MTCQFSRDGCRCQPPERGPLQWYPAPAVLPAPGTSRGRGLAITTLVLSAVALLGVVAVGLWVLIATARADDTGTSGPLTGELSAAGGGQVTGDTLARAVSARITGDGGEVSRMDCPETSRWARAL